MNAPRLTFAAATGALLMALTPSANAALPAAVAGEPLPSLAPMIKQAAPAVVNIAVEASVNSPAMGRLDDPFFQQFFGRRPARPSRASGSGVIVDARNGYIMTNHHVIDGADKIEITLFDDRTMEAQVIGSDPGTDVAIIQVDGDNLAQIPLADSDALEVGDFVVAIGNPFGFSNTVTSGIVSALDRIGLNNDSYEDFIQTDAAINPGNSGGALLNLRGELVGINTAIISSAGGNNGIGFAIPINLASSVMTQILEYGEVRRGLLGVEISSTANRFEKDTRDEYKLGDRNGALVMAVTPDSAAEKAGIELNDIILSVNGDKTRNALELRNAIGFMAPGETASIEVLRDGRTRTVKAKLGTKASPVTTASVLETTDGAGLHEGLEGASFGELSREQARSLDGGVTVVEIERGSPAAASDLKAGDVIVKVNRKSVGTLADFRKQASNDNEQLMLTVVREGTSRLVFIG